MEFYSNRRIIDESYYKEEYGMKFIHTADWHLGKLVQGVYMTEDQAYILHQFIVAIENEKPDAVIIAGDLYDRAVPPTEAVHLLDEILERIVLQLRIPVLAIAGNHDSPSRLNFGSKIMRDNGCHIVGTLTNDLQPIVLHDHDGEVHFHLVPYCDPSVVRTTFQDDTVRTHNDAAKKIIEQIEGRMDSHARHVFVGHAFVTPYGAEEENTSDSERPLSIGGSEYVAAEHFAKFHYTALGHLHQAHYVWNETIRYAGSPLKYSISEEHHKKGFYVVEIDGEGAVNVEKRILHPRRDVRTVEASINELLTHPINDDYVFIRLTDELPVLSPMEKVRSVYPNALHVERKHNQFSLADDEENNRAERTKLSELELFHAFYKEVKGTEATQETEQLFKEVLNEWLHEESDVTQTEKLKPYLTI